MYEQLREAMDSKDHYKADVKVDIYTDNKNVYIDSEGDASITYNLDIEFREYGIKSIMPILAGDAIVYYVETDEMSDDMTQTDKEITVDLYNVRVDWVEGDGFYPVQLTLYLTETGEVDYKRSYLEFSYYKP
jgi:hypothetical protein